MSKNRDPLALSPNWHVDCTLAHELPDDRVVSSRFLFNLPFGAVTMALLVFFGLKLSTDLSLRFEIANSARRIADSRVEVASIKQMQREYTVVAAKIEHAHALARNRLFVYHFTTQLDLTIPLRIKPLDFATYFLVQYYDGYGESLRDYDQKRSSLRAGFSLVR